MGFLRTAVLLAVMTALFVGVGFLMAGPIGMVIAFLVACVMNFFAYWKSDRMVLKMHNAHVADPDTASEYIKTVAELARRAGLPIPKIYIIESDQPNAFATGRNPENASVAASTGLLNALSRDEVAGVMAHELAHIQNRDILTMTITATLAGAIGMMVNFISLFSNRNGRGFITSILIMFLAPMAAGIVQMAISRRREYEADRIGAEICGHPLWLASALEKIHTNVQRISNHTAEKHPASAHIFIANPLKGGMMGRLFSTHPAMENRIRILREMDVNSCAETTVKSRVDWSKYGNHEDRYGSKGRSRYKSDDPKKGPWG